MLRDHFQLGHCFDADFCDLTRKRSHSLSRSPRSDSLTSLKSPARTSHFKDAVETFFQSDHGGISFDEKKSKLLEYVDELQGNTVTHEGTMFELCTVNSQSMTGSGLNGDD